MVVDPELTQPLRAAITELWCATTAPGTPLASFPPTSPEQLRAVAVGVLESVEATGQRLVVAAAGDHIVGCCFLVPNPSPSMAHWMELKAMMVGPARQNKGISASLLQAASRFAFGPLGLDFLSLTVQDGTGAKRFYERHGWVVVGCVGKAIRTANGYRDLWTLTRPATR